VIYSSILGYVISLIVQFSFILNKLDLSEHLYFDRNLITRVIKDSFIIKLSSVINGFTDIVIAYLFTSWGEGFYAIYSYARKFALAIYNISNGPLIKKFNTEIAPLILKQDYLKIKQKARKTFLHIFPLFIIGNIICYLLLPIVLPFVTDKFILSDIDMMQNIFLLMNIFYGMLIIEYLFMAIISQFHAFKYGLIINIIYATIFSLSNYLIYYIYESYTLVLVMLIISLSISLLLEYQVIKKKLFKGNEQ
jgi:Na+-driven multidrug efflux pump